MVQEFREILSENFLEIETAELLAKLKENDVPAAKCLDYTEVLNHPQYEANGTIDTVRHPIMGEMRRVKLPAQFGGQRLEPASNSPAHGEHTRDVLSEMGRSDEEVAALYEQGVAAPQISFD